MNKKFTKNRRWLKSVFAVALALVMAIPAFAQPVFANGTEHDYAHTQLLDFANQELSVLPSINEAIPFGDNEMIDFLTYTLYNDAIGLVGFEGPYCIDGMHHELVDVVVMLRTLPAVALSILDGAMGEVANGTRARSVMDVAEQRVAAYTPFVAEATAGHDKFLDQLGGVIVPFSATGGIEILGHHYTLFNGIVMRVPVMMLEEIAALPEVFLVHPLHEWFTMAELENMTYEQWNTRERLDVVAYYEAISTMADDIGAFELSSSFAGPGQPYTPHYFFNLEAIQLFEIERIQNELGLTGAGVRVGIIDTGVDYRHPVFRNSLVPSDRYTPGIGYYTLPGGNMVIDPAVANRTMGRGASPMESLHLGTASNHGTHVAGTVKAMAPDIEMWAWRALNSGGGSMNMPNSVGRSIEHAFDAGMDIINLSIGTRTNNPLASTATFMTNLATLAGMQSVTSSGNDGMGGNPRQVSRGGWFSLGGGNTGTMNIIVGSGTGGNNNSGGIISRGATVNGVALPDPDTIATNPARGLEFTGAPGRENWHLNPIVMDNAELEYVWFNRLLIPTGFRTEPGSPAHEAFMSFVDDVITYLLEGEDLTGKVAVINRGPAFDAMSDLAKALNAEAVVMINNAAGHARFINNIGFYQQVPIYTMLMEQGNLHIGVPAEGTVTIAQLVELGGVGTGVLSLGVAQANRTLDLLTASSSVGPFGPIDVRNITTTTTMELAPHVIAPGASIFSANNLNHATRWNGRPYVQMGGTSMSSPAVAGVAALLVQQNPDISPLEIRSRLMSTARPLADFAGEYGVMEVGAGFIDPWSALNTNAHIVTYHITPWDSRFDQWLGSGMVSGLPGGWSYQYMSALSFGNIPRNAVEGNPAQTAVIPVTIRNGGAGVWDYSLNLFVPTQTRPADAAGLALNHWGPELPHITDGVTVEISRTSPYSFDVTMTHDGVSPFGMAQGYLSFTNGDTVVTTPISAFFNAEHFVFELPPDPPTPQPLQAHPGSVIWTPVISSWFNHRDNIGATDPRAFPGAQLTPASWDANPAIAGIINRSNYSSITFGFNDPSGNTASRQVFFSFGPYGTAFEDGLPSMGGWFTLAPNTLFALNTGTGSLDVVRSVMGGSLVSLGAAQLEAGIVAISGGIVLEPGKYTLWAHVIHGAGQQYDLIQPFTFYVTDERPSIDDFNAYVFQDMMGQNLIAIEGRVASPGHELGLNSLYSRLPMFAHGPFDLSRNAVYRHTAAGQVQIPVNANGTFRHIMAFTDQPITVQVESSVGYMARPYVAGVPTLLPRAGMVSAPGAYVIAPVTNVTDIIGIPEAWRVDLPLSLNQAAVLVPDEANGNHDIAWSIISGGAIATLADGVLTANSEGQVVVRATIADAVTMLGVSVASLSRDFVIDFYAPVYHNVTFIVERGGIANGVNVYTEEVSISVQVPHGEALPAIPAIGTRTGFQFVGWYPSNPADHTGNVYSDLTFRAVFTELWHYVTFTASEGGEISAPFGQIVRIRDGFTFWPDRVPTPVAAEGFVFVEWYPANPAGHIVRESMTFTAMFEPIPAAEPTIVSVTPSPATAARGSTVEITVTTQNMPDGTWVESNVAWRAGLSIVGGPRFYVVDNQATITIAIAADAPLGQDGFSVAARIADAWGASVILDHSIFVVTVVAE